MLEGSSDQATNSGDLEVKSTGNGVTQNLCNRLLARCQTWKHGQCFTMGERIRNGKPLFTMVIYLRNGEMLIRAVKFVAPKTFFQDEPVVVGNNVVDVASS